MCKTMEEKREIVRRLRPIDDILFEKLAEDKEVAQEIIRVILSDPDIVVESVIPQDSVPNLMGRSVRLDALCRLKDGRKCNVEVQRSNNDKHLKRVRYNASGITWSTSDKGTNFDKIPDVCVIYISEFDFIGEGRTIYHIDKVVRETGKVVSDGLEEVFVNTTIDDGTEISDLMRCFLQASVANEKFPELSRRMDELKNTEEGVSCMCAVIEKYYGEDIEKARKEARAQGQAEGMADAIIGLITTGIITLSQGASQLKISEDKLRKMIDAKQ